MIVLLTFWERVLFRKKRFILCYFSFEISLFEYCFLFHFIHVIWFVWQDVECLGCGKFKMWDFRNIGCWGCEMFGMWYVRDVGCSGCEMFGMWDVRNVRYSGCGMLGIWDVQDVACSGFRMWDVPYVGCLLGCGMLTYKMSNMSSWKHLWETQENVK